MKIEITKVPVGKSPLDVLSEMGEQISKSWIYLHENAYLSLIRSKGVTTYTRPEMKGTRTTIMVWKTTKKSSEIVVHCEEPNVTKWGRISFIMDNHIPYKNCPEDPENIFFLKMEE